MSFVLKLCVFGNKLLRCVFLRKCLLIESAIIIFDKIGHNDSKWRNWYNKQARLLVILNC